MVLNINATSEHIRATLIRSDAKRNLDLLYKALDLFKAAVDFRESGPSGPGQYGNYADPQSRFFNGDGFPNEEQDLDATCEMAHVILRECVEYRLTGIDAFEPLVELWLDPENDQPVRRHEAREAAHDAFLVGWYARGLVEEREKAQNTEVTS